MKRAAMLITAAIMVCRLIAAKLRGPWHELDGMVKQLGKANMDAHALNLRADLVDPLLPLTSPEYRKCQFLRSVPDDPLRK